MATVMDLKLSPRAVARTDLGFATAFEAIRAELRER